ncbi:hypothetical protein ACFS07_01150 [Undibacterium arcticum]
MIAFTVLIKLLFFPLSAASFRSMAKMKLVTPKNDRNPRASQVRPAKDEPGHDGAVQDRKRSIRSAAACRS